jgi:hypothetical protein
MFIDFVNVENFVKKIGESTISTSTKSINMWSPTIILEQNKLQGVGQSSWGQREYYFLFYYGCHTHTHTHKVVIFVI